jgi:hypothetical protein
MESSERSTLNHGGRRRERQAPRYSRRDLTQHPLASLSISDYMTKWRAGSRGVYENLSEEIL